MSEKPVVAAAETEDLPKTIVRRLVKDKLSQLSKDSEIQVLRDSLHAFSESSRIFIHYLSATANDICKESKRQTINAEDVFKALEEIEFPEFVEPLRDSLEEFRQKNARKRSASSKPKEAKNIKTKKGPVENGGEEQVDGEKEKEDNARKRTASSKPKKAKKIKTKKGPVENGGEEQEDGEKDKEDNARKRSASSKPKEAKKSTTKKGPLENGGEKQEDGEKDKEENARKRSASSKPKEAKKSKTKKGPAENGGEEQEDGEKDKEDNE